MEIIICNSLSITNIIQTIVPNGMKISFVPTSNLTQEYSFDIIIKNSVGIILVKTIVPIIYVPNGSPAFVIIPNTNLPLAGESINIKITVDNTCNFTKIYTILSYVNIISTTTSTTSLNKPKLVDKYIKIQPNINSSGFTVGKTYFYKCSSNIINSNDCYNEFSKITDLSKILDKLPLDGVVVECPPSLRWILLETICVGNTGITTTIPTSTKTSCATGLKLDSIYYESFNNYRVNFTSTDVQSISWTVYNNNNIVIISGNSGFLVEPKFLANFGVLINGTYTLRIISDNCSSNILDGTLTFLVTNGVATTTTTTTLPNIPSCSVTGGVFSINNITRQINTTTYSVSCTASNLSTGTIKLYKSNALTVELLSQSVTITSNSFTADLGIRDNGEYQLKLIGNSCNGNTTFNFTIQNTVIVAPITSFNNVLKGVPIELVNGKYNPNLFETIGVVKTTDAILGKSYPNWAVAWQAEGSNFKNNNKKTPDLGISFMYDKNPVFNAGDGIRCVDWIYETNPNTGQPWVNNIDTQCDTSFTNFESAIPFHERAFSGYGIGSPNDRNEWIANSPEFAFDKGIEAVQGRIYGHGDKIDGKVNIGLANADIEIGLEQGFEYYPRHLAFLLGMGKSSNGYVFSQYSAAINGVGTNLSYYPDANGVFPSIQKKLDGSDYKDGNGLTVTNNVPISPDWNPLSKITLSNRGVVNQGIIDYPNILPCIEISSTSDMTYKHGQTYPRKGGWKYEYVINQTTTPNGNPVANTNPQLYDYSGFVLSYNINNPIDNTVVNKFGLNKNTEHIIADIICYGDVNKWWSVNKLNNRKVILQSKITCDRANMGIFYEAGFTNNDLRFRHYGREYGFDIGGFTALTGCEWQIWDRNTQENLDGYHGAFGIINLLNQRKNFGSDIFKSFVDIKPTANFLLWNSEISYDNGLTWKKEKAPDYILNMKSIPQRQCITSEGYWCGFLARPEKTEDKECKLRVSYNNKIYTHSITVNMWETVNPFYGNVSLQNIPDSAKDYYYFLFKLNGLGGEVF